jgi:GTP-dependent phosphoenolpyruvate carboxykinase
MFLSGVFGKGGRKTYLAALSKRLRQNFDRDAAGRKQSVGDDIAYFREVTASVWLSTLKRGIFGIIQNVTQKDDPAIWDVLTKERRSHLLECSGKRRQTVIGSVWESIFQLTAKNFSGQWHTGKKGKRR